MMAIKPVETDAPPPVVNNTDTGVRLKSLEVSPNAPLSRKLKFSTSTPKRTLLLIKPQLSLCYCPNNICSPKMHSKMLSTIVFLSLQVPKLSSILRTRWLWSHSITMKIYKIMPTSLIFPSLEWTFIPHKSTPLTSFMVGMQSYKLVRTFNKSTLSFM